MWKMEVTSNVDNFDGVAHESDFRTSLNHQVLSNTDPLGYNEEIRLD